MAPVPGWLGGNGFPGCGRSRERQAGRATYRSRVSWGIQIGQCRCTWPGCKLTPSVLELSWPAALLAPGVAVLFLRRVNMAGVVALRPKGPGREMSPIVVADSSPMSPPLGLASARAADCSDGFGPLGFHISRVP